MSNSKSSSSLPKLLPWASCFSDLSQNPQGHPYSIPHIPLPIIFIFKITWRYVSPHSTIAAHLVHAAVTSPLASSHSLKLVFSILLLPSTIHSHLGSQRDPFRMEVGLGHFALHPLIAQLPSLSEVPIRHNGSQSLYQLAPVTGLTLSVFVHSRLPRCSLHSYHRAFELEIPSPWKAFPR